MINIITTVIEGLVLAVMACLIVGIVIHCYRHLRGITQSSAVIWLTFFGLLVGGAVRPSIRYNG